MNYTVFSIGSGGRGSYVEEIHRQLNAWDYQPTWCINGYRADLVEQQKILHENIPYSATLKPGQLGIWYTLLNALCYADKPLVTFEDDAILGHNFIEEFNKRTAELPDDTDFFSLFIPRDQDVLFYHDGPTKHLNGNPKRIRGKYLSKVWSRYGGVSMMWTPQGAEKFLKIVKREGMVDQWDNMVYARAKQGLLNGYCSRPDLSDLVYITGEEESTVQDTPIFWRK